MPNSSVRLRAPAGSPATKVDNGTDTAAPANDRLKLHGEIARGGMGAVLRGFDADLGREIAVKVLLESHQARLEQLQRFIEEAQIGGQLQHPGVVPVYELGLFPDRRPYFTMKLVHGQTLSVLLQERPSPQENRPHFLKIFEQVCQTLAYAHSRGVIHRDLKPGNIMVGAFGEVQVMDWGLAKVVGQRGAETVAPAVATETTIVSPTTTPPPRNLTTTGSVMGTPAYMPPEQAKGEIERLDERCDVFGLGAILCEILTGDPPYRGRTLAEVQRQAMQAELADAYTRLDGCGADAELIRLTKRCLTPRLEDRPRHASELTQELTAYLNSVEQRLRQAELAAVEAKTKAVEELKRRRVTFRLAAGILLALLAGLAASLWQMNRAMVAEEVAQANERKAVTLAEAEKQAKVAEQKAKDAEATRRREAEAVATLLEQFFQELNPRLERLQTEQVRDRLVERLDFMAARLTKDFAGDPLTRARLLHMLGSTQLALWETTKAEALLEAAAKERRTRLGPDHPDTLTTLNNLGSAYKSNGKITEAIQLYQDLYERMVLQLGEQHLETLPALGNLASAYRAAGKLTEAAAIFKKAYEIRRSQLGPDDPATLLSLNNLGRTYLDAGKPAEAVPYFQQAYDGIKHKLGPTNPQVIGAQLNLAKAHLDAKQYPEAEAVVRPVLAVMEKHQPNVWVTFGIQSLLGNILVQQQKYAEAEPLLLQSFAGLKERLPRMPPTVRQPRLQETVEPLIQLYDAQGKKEQAAKWRKELDTIKAMPKPAPQP
jgi:serine/threonine-protein kinase